MGDEDDRCIIDIISSALNVLLESYCTALARCYK